MTQSNEQTRTVLESGLKTCRIARIPAVFNFYVEDSASSLVINVVGIDVHKANMVYIRDPAQSGINVTEHAIYSDINTVTVAIGEDSSQARAVSSITVLPGFTSTADNDYVAESPFSARGVDNRTYAVFRVSPANFTVISGKQGSANVNEPWNDSLYTFEVQPRDESTCSYQYITTNFQMTSAPLFKMQIHGTTSTKFQFQRTFYFSQSYDTATTCGLHGRPNLFGECICQPGYSGEYCDEPICENGGTRSMSICICKLGFYGQLCES
ncbi:hypothetical protein COOONC_23629, partial [Cooperia oncophora]